MVEFIREKSKVPVSLLADLKKVFDIFQFTNSANASKDLGFKWLCTAEKFNGVKNDSARKVLKTCDAGFRKLMTPLHEGITKWFDGISKSTVHKDMTERLYYVDRKKYYLVQAALQKNLAERHIRGGLSTRLKYRLKHKRTGD